MKVIPTQGLARCSLGVADEFFGVDYQPRLHWKATSLNSVVPSIQLSFRYTPR